MFQTKQKPHQTLQFIGAETEITISMLPASPKPVGELIPIGMSWATCTDLSSISKMGNWQERHHFQGMVYILMLFDKDNMFPYYTIRLHNVIYVSICSLRLPAQSFDLNVSRTLIF